MLWRIGGLGLLLAQPLEATCSTAVVFGGVLRGFRCENMRGIWCWVAGLETAAGAAEIWWLGGPGWACHASCGFCGITAAGLCCAVLCFDGLCCALLRHAVLHTESESSGRQEVLQAEGVVNDPWPGGSHRQFVRRWLRSTRESHEIPLES